MGWLGRRRTSRLPCEAWTADLTCGGGCHDPISAASKEAHLKNLGLLGLKVRLSFTLGRLQPGDGPVPFKKDMRTNTYGRALHLPRFSQKFRLPGHAYAVEVGIKQLLPSWDVKGRALCTLADCGFQMSSLGYQALGREKERAFASQMHGGQMHAANKYGSSPQHIIKHVSRVCL